MTMDQQDTGTDYKLSRSDLLEEIKEQIIIMNEHLTNAETEFHFGRASAHGAPQPTAEVYRALSQLIKLTREILTPSLRDDAEKWLDETNHLVDKGEFLESAKTFSRDVQEDLFEIGIKDTNVRVPIPYPMSYFMKFVECNDEDNI